MNKKRFNCTLAAVMGPATQTNSLMVVQARAMLACDCVGYLIHRGHVSASLNYGLHNTNQIVPDCPKDERLTSLRQIK
jgi:hypothetical protein